MYTLKFTLKQHTPNIHFQHDQEGATLRATEVKPKLDRALIKKIGNGNYDHGVIIARERKWITSMNSDSLDLKMKIQASANFEYPVNVPRLDRENHVDRDNRGNPRSEGFPCFFGNMGDANRENEKKFVYAQNRVYIKINTNCESLFLFMEKGDGYKTIARFFNTENFGTRQSKGFGSFSVIKENGEMDFEISRYYFDVYLRNRNINQLKTQHQIRFPRVQMTDEQLILVDHWRQVFNNINLFHKVLKSGYNQQRGYVKSTLFKYFKDEHNIQWDKKTIKEVYFNDKLSRHQDNHPDEDILLFDEEEQKIASSRNHMFLVRDLLGLTSQAEWNREYNNAVISKTNSEIDRFKSPVTYKPILRSDEEGDFFSVFIFLHEIPEEFLNKPFNVTVNNHGTLVLDTPDRSKFTTSKYFEYLAGDSFAIEDLVNSENADTDTISDMFNMLKPQENE